MISILVAIVSGLWALAFVLYPLYRHAGRGVSEEAASLANAQDNAALLPLSEQEQTARNALQEVELDYQLGNITEADYSALRERYMQRALVALKSRSESEQEIDAQIEEQLRSMKESYEKANQ